MIHSFHTTSTNDCNDKDFIGYFIAGLIFGVIIAMALWLIYLSSRVNIRSESFIVTCIERSDSKEYRYTITPINEDESGKILFINSNNHFNIGDTLKLK